MRIWEYSVMKMAKRERTSLKFTTNPFNQKLTDKGDIQYNVRETKTNITFSRSRSLPSTTLPLPFFLFPFYWLPRSILESNRFLSFTKPLNSPFTRHRFNLFPTLSRLASKPQQRPLWRTERLRRGRDFRCRFQRWWRNGKKPLTSTFLRMQKYSGLIGKGEWSDSW